MVPYRPDEGRRGGEEKPTGRAAGLVRHGVQGEGGVLVLASFGHLGAYDPGRAAGLVRHGVQGEGGVLVLASFWAPRRLRSRNLVVLKGGEGTASM